MTDIQETWVTTKSGLVATVSSLGLGPRDCWDRLEQSHIILIIPGNPGLACFYSEFMLTLHSTLSDPNTSIWAVDHVGHLSPSPSLLPSDQTFSLEDQVSHKLDLLQELVPPTTRITLVGHSVGCKVVMDMEARNKSHTFSSFFFLFPMMEKMLETPGGRKVQPFTVFRLPVVLLLAIINILLPDWLLNFSLRRIYPKSSQLFLKAAAKFRNPNYLNNCLVMAKDEIETVHDLDVETIRKMVGRLHIYYGASDSWCPLEYRDRLLEAVPELRVENAKLCDRGIAHAFVEHSASEMAEIVADWMLEI